MTDKATLELCRLTIRDQVRAAQAMLRASHFNRDPNTEFQISVIEARMRAIEALVFAEMHRIEQRELGTDRESMLIKALRLAVEDQGKSREQFKFYEASHRQKGTEDADAKALVNKQHAERIHATMMEIVAILGTDVFPEVNSDG